MIKHNQNKSLKRQIRVRSKIRMVSNNPRLSVFRSNRYISAQIIDDSKGITLVSANSAKIKGKPISKLARAQAVGQEIAQLAKKKKIKTVVFDRGKYRYHGQVKALAETARLGGLKF